MFVPFMGVWLTGTTGDVPQGVIAAVWLFAVVVVLTPVFAFGEFCVPVVGLAGVAVVVVVVVVVAEPPVVVAGAALVHVLVGGLAPGVVCVFVVVWASAGRLSPARSAAEAAMPKKVARLLICASTPRR